MGRLRIELKQFKVRELRMLISGKALDAGSLRTGTLDMKRESQHQLYLE